jgi:hypothetical protein
MYQSIFHLLSMSTALSVPFSVQATKASRVLGLTAWMFPYISFPETAPSEYVLCAALRLRCYTSIDQRHANFRDAFLLCELFLHF